MNSKQRKVREKNPVNAQQAINETLYNCKSFDLCQKRRKNIFQCSNWENYKAPKWLREQH